MLTANAGGCVRMRRAASSMKCRRITVPRNILTLARPSNSKVGLPAGYSVSSAARSALSSSILFFHAVGSVRYQAIESVWPSTENRTFSRS